MNKKGKNKKGKVPNPIPSQEEKPGDKVEDVGVVGDKGDLGKPSDLIENVGDKIESVKEDRVPEIVSEIIPATVDIKDEETPKKPKRNRGKKKKGKEDDFDDTLDDNPKESALQSSVEEPKTDTQEIEKEPLDMPIVTPTARKKKNKKKNVDQKIEESESPDLQAVVPPVAEPVVLETQIKEEATKQSEPAQQEVKSSKKKNKKKKRNDSEKSDREEISCTAAFQKLIDVSDESSDIKIQENIEEPFLAAEGFKVETDIQTVKDILPEETVTEKNTNISVDPPKEKESQQAPVSEGKSKKKNKKDKKHIPKPEEVIMPFIDKPVKESALLVQLEPTDAIIKEDPFPSAIQMEKSESLVEQTSPKPKAKIAKPVEKKRKGKQDQEVAETFTQDIITTEKANIEEQLPQPILETDIKVPDKEVTTDIETIITPDIKISEKDVISDMETINKPEEMPAVVTDVITSSPDQLKELTLEDFEPLNLPDKAMGKKRKKGPKIPKTPDVSFEILEPSVEATNKQLTPEIIEISKEPIASESVISKDEQVSITSELSGFSTIVDNPIESKPTEEPTMPTGVKDHILLTPEFTEDKTFIKVDCIVVTEKPAEEQKFEVKTGKKRKKSPKPPKKDIVPEAPTTTTETPKPFEEYVLNPDATKEMGEKIDASNITRMYDIEISSIKADESEGSICDTVPDITYPRASSQQLLDDNNNTTVIREIFPVREITPKLPVVECTETQKTDIPTAPKEHNVSPSKEEKTDLKSKMMEVNQDMEELRLSIERSLAELTAMEKSEEAIETRFEESKKDVTNIDQNQSKDEHEKIIEISDAEKSAIEKPLEEMKSTDIIPDGNKTIEEQLFSIMGNEQYVKDETVCPGSVGKEIESKIEDITVMESSLPEVAKVVQPVTDIEGAAPIMIAPQPVTPVDTSVDSKLLSDAGKVEEAVITPAPLTPPEEKKVEPSEPEKKDVEIEPKEEGTQLDTPPVCPARKDHKNKHKKKKGKQDFQSTTQTSQSTQSTTTSQSTTQETKKEEKTDSKSEKKGDSKQAKEKGKQQASDIDAVTEKDLFSDYEPIEKFEDALTSSVDDVNKTFEMIVNESQEQTNPKINIIAPDDEKTPVSPPKNLLGHPDIPVPSSKRDYKKEKNKIPNEITAKVKIKDSVEVEKKQSKNTQTVNKLKDLKDCRVSDNEEFVYKYSFRKVFLQTACHVCKKDLAGCRLPCCYCNLVFYCGIKHKDEDWIQHQALCFAVSTIGHLKDQKHIYGDAKNIVGHDYRLIRMQMIVSCEKVLKRRLVPWEQEALLYPRVCAHPPCREWRQVKLSDCQGCGQISFCTDHPEHLPKTHARWCKSYSLYQKLVCYQQTKGRLEPRLPTKVMQEQYEIPEKINEVLAAMYEEKIDMNDIQYAALTQLATAPLTAAYCHQLCRNKNTTANGYKNSTFTIHVVGAELQFEADALNKWEVFFLHLRPDLQELKVVLINYNLNPSNLPLELLGRIKLCENCRQNKRRVILSFQDKRTYADYKSSEDFVVPDIVCAFNPSIQRSSVYNGKDPWPSTVNIILKQKIPFIITAYTITELHKDCIRIKECSETGYNFISEPKYNNFASVRPDRNFISDDEMPLLFKNYCFSIICG